MKFQIRQRFTSGVVLASNDVESRVYGIYYVPTDGEGAAVPAYYLLHSFETEQAGRAWCEYYHETRMAIVTGEAHDGNGTSSNEI